MYTWQNLLSCKSSSEVKGQRNMYDQVESSVPNLKSLYIDITTYGSILVPLLNNKLPSELRVVFSRKCENDIWSIYDMLKCLKTGVEAKEWSMFIGTSSELEKENKDRKYTTSSFLNNAQGKWCHFCELSNHVASKCLKVTNAASRKQSLHRKGLCCMFSYNLASSCNSKYKYHTCNGKHHISISAFEKGDVLWHDCHKLF